MLEKIPEAIGQALAGVRAGLDQIAFNTLGLRQGLAAIEVTSLAFADHAPIPARYTADGEGISPPLAWSGVPAAARSLLLLVEDADSPTPHPLVHAIVVGLDAADGAFGEGAIAPPDAGEGDAESDAGGGLHLGRNSMLRVAWLPPDPPPGHGVHRYAFQLFALVEAPAFSATPGRDEVLAALRQHALASGLLIGSYERPDSSIKLPATAPVAGA